MSNSMYLLKKKIFRLCKVQAKALNFIYIAIILYCEFAYSIENPTWKVSHAGIVFDFHPDYFENISTDPILGEFLCRPLIRYNSQKNNYDFPILKSVTEVKRGSSWHWEFQIRTELSWGNGEAFTSKDLKILIEEFWPTRIGNLYGINLPENGKISIEGAHNLTIQWDSKPKVGPFVIAKIPVMKPRELSKGLKAFHCIGRYKIDSTEDGTIHMSAKSKIPVGFPKNLILYPPNFRNSINDKFDLILSFANQQTSFPRRLSDEPAKCTKTVLTPYLSLITWNPEADITSTSQLRRTLTSAIPRGELLRSGAAFLGELSTGLFSKISPAYSKSADLIPFDILNASRNFETLGYKRTQAFGPRLTKDGKSELFLNISSPIEGFNLAKKIVADTFASLGIKVNFISNSTQNEVQLTHGHMESIFLNSNYDYLIKFFDQNSKETYPFFSIQNENLQRLVNQFKNEIGNQSFDLNLLAEIHNSLVDLELASTLFQHKLCIQIDPNYPHSSQIAKLF